MQFSISKMARLIFLLVLLSIQRWIECNYNTIKSLQCQQFSLLKDISVLSLRGDLEMNAAHVTYATELHLFAILLWNLVIHATHVIYATDIQHLCAFLPLLQSGDSHRRHNWLYWDSYIFSLPLQRNTRHCTRDTAHAKLHTRFTLLNFSVNLSLSC